MTARRSLPTALALVLLAAPALASPTFSLLGGGALLLGRDTRVLRDGPALEVRVAPSGRAALAPFARLEWQRLRTVGSTLHPITDVNLLLFVPVAQRLERTAFELGLERRFGGGEVQLALEGGAGLDWVHPSIIEPALRNDRRPDPALPPAQHVGGVGAVASVGVGLRVPIVSRLALGARARLEATTASGLVHPPLALLAGATWGANAPPAGAPGRWRMRLAAGPAWKQRPLNPGEDSRLGRSASVAFVHPLGEHFAIECSGEWAQSSDRQPLILYQVRNEFGETVPVYGENHATWNAVAVMPGVRAQLARGPWRAWVRGGAGFGHTGGEGVTQPVPVIDLVDFSLTYVDVRAGFGRAAGGAAWSAGAAIERDLAGPVALVVEGYGWGVSTKFATVAFDGVRAGVELR